MTFGASALAIPYAADDVVGGDPLWKTSDHDHVNLIPVDDRPPSRASSTCSSTWSPTPTEDLAAAETRDGEKMRAVLRVEALGDALPQRSAHSNVHLRQVDANSPPFGVSPRVRRRRANANEDLGGGRSRCP